MGASGSDEAAYANMELGGRPRPHEEIGTA